MAPFLIPRMEETSGKTKDIAKDIRHDQIRQPMPPAVSQSRTVRTCGRDQAEHV